MDMEFFMPELAKREENFFNGILPTTSEEKLPYIDLQFLASKLVISVNKMQGTYSDAEIIRKVFAYIYDYLIDRDGAYKIFDKATDETEEPTLYDDIFDACLFISLCEFLYESKRIKGMSLRKFIYLHSPERYNVKGTPNYFNYEHKTRFWIESNSDNPDTSSDKILAEDDKLRQYRKRLLSKRPVYHHSSECSAIRKVSEHEWMLYFSSVTKNADKEIRDMVKRVRNLYTDISFTLSSKMDEKYIECLDNACEKFCSKIEKIQYGQFLNIGKFFLNHINRDKTCYGINLYRFEKQIRLYRITSDVNQMLSCNDEVQLEHIIDCAIRLDNIIFPKLYKYFSNLPSAALMQLYTDTFLSFMDTIVQSSRLIIDKLVEENVFGKDWDQFFLKMTNELAETVLYDPAKVNYSLKPELQREFQIYLLEPVNRAISNRKNVYYEMQNCLSASDDEI